MRILATMAGLIVASSVFGQGAVDLPDTIYPGATALNISETRQGFPELTDVKLVAKDRGEVALKAYAGRMSTTPTGIFQVIKPIFLYTGTNAEIRTKDRRPTFLVKYGKEVKGNVFLVRIDSLLVDRRAGLRRVVAKFYANDFSLDSGEIDCDVVSDGEGIWKIQPKKDLPPGEYGIWHVLHYAKLFGFGVDS